MKHKHFEFLEHTGDVKFRAYGDSVEAVFASCAKALSYALSRGKPIADKMRKELTLSGEDYEALLYSFLDELIYLFDAQQFIVSSAEVTIKHTDEYHLHAVVHGDAASRYKDLDSVKAATYAEMHVKQLKDKTWEAQAVLDV